ncbi:T9SS C-terminal target domain-containing protein [Sphingobacteriales bacterium UPWRP_1]|nr:hypothetical protein BVG80_09665 [Sphingobacteriales bacterium TSM_CSM]PSJ78094.1 T9SS C-terminal target domain-containing protein [Sphingobacteriales bacterium UPWRP_1]
MQRLLLPVLLFLSCNSLWAQMEWSPNYMQTIWYGDTIAFDAPYLYLHPDTSGSNIWQIGAPSKPGFNAAFSPPNAIVTDTLNPYPPNNHSWFDVYLGTFNFSDFYGNDMFIEMQHRFDTDTLKDGGFIQVSYDMGSTWMNIIQDTVWQDVNPAWENLNLYNQSNALYNGEPGFSGISNGWVTTGFTWHYTPVRNSHAPMPDTLILRFNFISDSLHNNRNGWMIDNIRLFAVDLGSGIGQTQSDSSIFSVYPNPAANKTGVRLNQPYQKVEYALFSASGSLVKEAIVQNTQEFDIDLSQISAGMYILRLIINNRLSTFEKLLVR